MGEREIHYHKHHKTPRCHCCIESGQRGGQGQGLQTATPPTPNPRRSKQQAAGFIFIIADAKGGADERGPVGQHQHQQCQRPQITDTNKRPRDSLRHDVRTAAVIGALINYCWELKNRSDFDRGYQGLHTHERPKNRLLSFCTGGIRVAMTTKRPLASYAANCS